MNLSEWGATLVLGVPIYWASGGTADKGDDAHERVSGNHDAGSATQGGRTGLCGIGGDLPNLHLNRLERPESGENNRAERASLGEAAERSADAAPGKDRRREPTTSERLESCDEQVE